MDWLADGGANISESTLATLDLDDDEYPSGLPPLPATDQPLMVGWLLLASERCASISDSRAPCLCLPPGVEESVCRGGEALLLLLVVEWLCFSGLLGRVVVLVLWAAL